MKNKLCIDLEDLNTDAFNYMTRFMSYQKDLMPLLLVSKKTNQLVSQCPAGKLSAQLYPESILLNRSAQREFFFNKVLKKENFTPFGIILACIYQLSTGNENLNLTYTVALFAALAFTVSNIKNGYHHFGLFETNRQEQLKQLCEPLQEPISYFK